MAIVLRSLYHCLYLDVSVVVVTVDWGSLEHVLAEVVVLIRVLIHRTANATCNSTDSSTHDSLFAHSSTFLFS